MIYRIKDSEDLAQAGWGAIVSVSGEVREAIGPLLDYRREQASVYQESRYRELDFLVGETKTTFLARHGEGPGPLRAGSFPYYWLIIGDPEDIPFSFQYQLAWIIHEPYCL
ncbi:MAG TPA: hypothetical protein VF179_24165 [Thermoanaerobaculia bacterium]|nr:hypothetical protein [Thermoanaerobaculia bacterium]